MTDFQSQNNKESDIMDNNKLKSVHNVGISRKQELEAYLKVLNLGCKV